MPEVSPARSELGAEEHPWWRWHTARRLRPRPRSRWRPGLREHRQPLSGGAARSVTRVAGTFSGIPLTPGTAPESLSETGSTLLFPLFKAWAGAFHQEHHQVTITTGATGSGAGIADASAGTADVGASDAYLSSGDLVQNPELLNIPLAVAAQQLNYNLPRLAPGVHVRLDAGVLVQMYEGRITRWNSAPVAALNPGLGAGIIVAALLMAAACGRGLSCRLAEYR
jgi:ABC-type phosphate transport system substrate-binding protein